MYVSVDYNRYNLSLYGKNRAPRIQETKEHTKQFFLNSCYAIGMTF